MMYSEFVKGTGCKENEYNYNLFKKLELIYSNDDSVTKDEIYEMGKKLVDNSLSEEQLKWNADIKEQIIEKQEEIDRYTDSLERSKSMLEWEKMSEDKDDWYIASLKREIKYYREQIKALKDEVKTLRSCMHK